MLKIQKAAVIGAGTMGAQIAAHLANVGIPSFLLDIVPVELLPEEKKQGLTLQNPEVRNRVTQSLWEHAKRLSPPPLYLPEMADLVKIGNLEDHLPWLQEADWVIEAVVERMEVKRSIHAQIAAHCRPDTIVTTNTSGLPISEIIQALPSERRKYFFGTHFFNPPRYMRLLEMISAPETDPILFRSFAQFAEENLGKGVVYCKDTPGFISNRIGFFAIQHAIWLTIEEGLTIEEVDAITGPILGRPRSATFRLGDIVGIDLLTQIGQNLYNALKHDDQKKCFLEPPFIQEMLKRGWLGSKKNQGFYKRFQNQILALNYKNLDYHPLQEPKWKSLAEIKKIQNPAERIQTLCNTKDQAGQFAWKHLSAVISYAANHLAEIADDIVSVDRVLKWGFNWEIGPFEIWDALGVREVIKRLEEENRPAPTLAKSLLSSGKTAFHEFQGARSFFFDFKKKDYESATIPSDFIDLQILHQNIPPLQNKNASEGFTNIINPSGLQKIIREIQGVSLIDLDDGVVCLEFHSKSNTLGLEQLEFILEAEEEVDRNFIGMVIGNQGNHFSAGANLHLILKHIQNQEWDQLDALLRLFQKATGSLSRFGKPLVVACHGFTLGAGCEIVLGANHVVAAAETYIGLPESRVGLIPAGGGCKEMLIRCTENILDPKKAISEINKEEYFDSVRQAWEAIFFAKVSKSAHEGCALRYLELNSEDLVLNRDRLIGRAKAEALDLVASAYSTPPGKNIWAMGKASLDKFDEILQKLFSERKISKHDMKIGAKLAYILCGGDQASPRFVEAQHILDLEREALLSLSSQPKTIQRIEHMLQTGKPLEN